MPQSGVRRLEQAKQEEAKKAAQRKRQADKDAKVFDDVSYESYLAERDNLNGAAKKSGSSRRARRRLTKRRQ